jgi:heme exporter protein CcmB
VAYKMLSLIILQLKIEHKTLWRNSSNIAASISAALTIYLLIRFGFPPEHNQNIIPPMLLAALILSLLNASHNCFAEDAANDRIAAWHSAKLNIEWLILCRLIAYLLNIALPLIICFCLIIWLETGDLTLMLHSAKIMLMVSVATITCGLIASAINVSFNMAGQLSHLLTLPFLFSVVIFAAQSMINYNSIAYEWLFYIILLLTPACCLWVAKIL